MISKSSFLLLVFVGLLSAVISTGTESTHNIMDWEAQEGYGAVEKLKLAPQIEGNLTQLSKFLIQFKLLEPNLHYAQHCWFESNQYIAFETDWAKCYAYHFVLFSLMVSVGILIIQIIRTVIM